MADFPILFTGKDVSYEPKSTGELRTAKAQFDERFLEGKRFEAAERQRGKDFFYKAADVSPVQVSSEFLSREQEKVMGLFNDKWAGTFSKQGGTLTTAQQSEMFRDRKSMEAQQAQWLASQSRYERDDELIKRDALRAEQMFNHDKYRGKEKIMHETGVYEGGLEYSSINPGVYFTKNKLPGSNQIERSVEVVDGVEKTVETRVPGTEVNAKRFISDHILKSMKSNGRLFQGVVDDFVAQSEEAKAPYLIDGPVDTPEEKNAIIAWAEDYYLDRVLPTMRKVTPVSTSSSRGNISDREFTYADGIIKNKTGDGVLVFTKDGSGNVIGKGKALKSIKLDIPSSQVLSKSGKTLSEELGGEIQNDVITARPTSIGGTVKLVVTSPITIKKSSKDPNDIPIDAKIKEVDGVAYWEEKIPSGITVGVKLKDVRDELGTYLGGDAFKQALDENFKITEPAAKEAGMGIGGWIQRGIGKVEEFLTPKESPGAQWADK